MSATSKIPDDAVVFLDGQLQPASAEAAVFAKAWINGIPTYLVPNRGGDLVSNSGEPCGDSFIDPNKTCRVGEVDAPRFKTRAEGIAHFKALPTEEREFMWAGKQVKYQLRKGAPEQPPEKTPAYSQWFDKWVVDKGVTNDERSLASLNSKPTSNDEKEFQKSALESIGGKENDAVRIAVAEKIGFKPRGDLETDEEFRARLKAEDDNPDSVFSPKNPNRTHTLDYKGKAYTIAEAAFDSWTMSSHSSDSWVAVASKLAGEDFAARNAEFRRAVTPSVILAVDREWFDQEKQEAEIRAKNASYDLSASDEKDIDRYRMHLKGFEPFKDEYLRVLDQSDAARAELNPMRYNDPEYRETRLKLKAFDEQKAAIQRMAYGRIEALMALKISPSRERGIIQVRDEAKATFKKDTPIYRGLQLAPELTSEIHNALSNQGHYDLPVRRLSSWSEREALAKTFARHGQGKKQAREDDVGIVIKAVATKDNVWMHPKQPTYRSIIDENKKEGQKFNSGGVDQKEVVIELDESYFRITNENSYFI